MLSKASVTQKKLICMMAKKKQRKMHYPVIACHVAYYAHMLNDSAASEFPFLIYNLTFPQECYQVTFARHIACHITW
jgi:hypothetical protein